MTVPAQGLRDRLTTHANPGLIAIVLRLFAGLLLIVALAGCERKRSQAIVLEKEHIAARETNTSGVPAPSAVAQPDSSNGATDLAPGEIVVDGYVMKAEDRGTARDPRALPNEQWLAKVKTTDGARVFKIQAQPGQFEKLRVGDRVQVVYRVGKYSGTVWDAQIK